MTSPLLAYPDARLFAGPHRTDGRRHAHRSLGEALLWAAERGRHEEDAVPRTHIELTNATIDLMARLLRAAGRDVSDLRDEGVALLEEIETQMAVFGRSNGPSVGDPVTRAWYLLRESLKHATLLGPRGGSEVRDG